MLEKALLRAILRRAGQSGQVNQHGDRAGRGAVAVDCAGGQVQVEGHFAAGGGGIVGEFEQFAAERGDPGFFGDGHGG